MQSAEGELRPRRIHDTTGLPQPVSTRSPPDQVRRVVLRLRDRTHRESSTCSDQARRTEFGARRGHLSDGQCQHFHPGRSRPLSKHRHAHAKYALKCEESVKATPHRLTKSKSHQFPTSKFVYKIDQNTDCYDAGQGRKGPIYGRVRKLKVRCRRQPGITARNLIHQNSCSDHGREKCGE